MYVVGHTARRIALATVWDFALTIRNAHWEYFHHQAFERFS
jgi:hypothetical protein